MILQIWSKIRSITHPKLFLKFFEFFRFGLVGVIATLIHLLAYFLLIDKVTSNLAYSFGYAIGFVFNFFASSFFTFKARPTFGKFLAFILTNVFNLLLQLALLNLLLWINMGEKLAPIFVLTFAIPINYFLVQKVFKTKIF